MKKRRLLLSVVAALGFTTATMAQVPSYVPTNGLVGWWPFNGNANDESGNNYNGTIQNNGANGLTYTQDRNSIGNSALNFESNPSWSSFGPFVEILNTSNITLSEYSMNLWIKVGFNCSVGELINKGPDNVGFFSRIQDQFAGITFGSLPQALNYSINIDTTQWKMLTLSRDNLGIGKLYIDGNLILSASCSSPSNNAYNFAFGLMPSGGTNGSYYPFQGKMDDICIWNRALTDQEISDLYGSLNCSNDITISPVLNTQNIGSNAIFTVSTSDPNPSFIWQSDFGQGFQTLNNYGNYSGVNTNTLNITNVQLANHNQQIRAISTSGNCLDTSNIAIIQIADTCIATVFDTVLTTVTDTLIINTTLSLPAPNNENTILIYPNPASDHITIDNGNYSAMAGYSIKITNNAGQEVFLNAINQQQFYVDLSTWTGNGLYFVHLIDSQNNTVTVRKIVLQ
jgi:hypothetical protein